MAFKPAFLTKQLCDAAFAAVAQPIIDQLDMICVRRNWATKGYFIVMNRLVKPSDKYEVNIQVMIDEVNSLLTRDRHAVQEVFDLIRQHLGAVATDVIVWHRTIGADNKLSEYEVGVGRDILFATVKAYLSWWTGLTMRELLEQHPDLLPDFAVLWEGSVVEPGRVVAFSGASPDKNGDLAHELSRSIGKELAFVAKNVRNSGVDFAHHAG